MLTQLVYKYYGDSVQDIMPALGSHEPVTADQRERMFGNIPEGLFRVHDWRNDVETASSHKSGSAHAHDLRPFNSGFATWIMILRIEQ